jgi:hypothetical protein
MRGAIPPLPFIFMNWCKLSSDTTKKVKGKAVPVLLLTEHNAMKAYWWSGGVAPLTL